MISLTYNFQILAILFIIGVKMLTWKCSCFSMLIFYFELSNTNWLKYKFAYCLNITINLLKLFLHKQNKTSLNFLGSWYLCGIPYCQLTINYVLNLKATMALVHVINCIIWPLIQLTRQHLIFLANFHIVVNIVLRKKIGQKYVSPV